MALEWRSFVGVISRFIVTNLNLNGHPRQPEKSVLGLWFYYVSREFGGNLLPVTKRGCLYLAVLTCGFNLTTEIHNTVSYNYY